MVTDRNLDCHEKPNKKFSGKGDKRFALVNWVIYILNYIYIYNFFVRCNNI